MFAPSVCWNLRASKSSSYEFDFTKCLVIRQAQWSYAVLCICGGPSAWTPNEGGGLWPQRDGFGLAWIIDFWRCKMKDDVSSNEMRSGTSFWALWATGQVDSLQRAMDHHRVLEEIKKEVLHELQRVCQTDIEKIYTLWEHLEGKLGLHPIRS